MNVDELLDQARAASPIVIGALAALAAFLTVLAIGVQLRVRRLRRELAEAQEQLVDRDTGLLPRSALRVRLGAELAWAATSRTTLSVAVLRIRGARFTQATHVLRGAMREEESAFVLGDQHVAVELWGVDSDAAAVATRRLGEDLARAGHPVVDAGIANLPRDGSDVETLVAAARRDLRPVDDPRPAGSTVTASDPARTRARHVGALLLGVLPWFGAFGVLLLVTWRLLPAAIEPALDAGGARSSEELAYAMLAAIGLPLGAALLHASCWNLGGGTMPLSRPLGRAGLRMGAVIILLVGAPLAWGIFAPLQPPEVSDAFGATLAVLALVLLALLHARQLVHVPIAVLVPIAALGAAIAWASVEIESLPIVANAGRLLLAASLGALLARLVERASWLVVLALLAGVIDSWSVHADGGLTNRLLESAERGDTRIVDLLLFTGPSVDGVPLFAIGVTDLVFLALFLAWSHDWRLDLRFAGGALLVGLWGAVILGQVLDQTVPVLPYLAGVMVCVVAIRSIQLRRRARRWSAHATSRGDGGV